MSAWELFDGHRDSSVARRPGASTPDRPSRHRPPNVASNKIHLAFPMALLGPGNAPSLAVEAPDTSEGAEARMETACISTYGCADAICQVECVAAVAYSTPVRKGLSG